MDALPQLSGRPMVTDGGLETDLIFHHGVDLPEFAAYPLVGATRRDACAPYYDGYADVAGAAGAGLRLEAPTWRANPDWGARLGHDRATLADANRQAVELLHGFAAGLGRPSLRGDGDGDGRAARGRVRRPDGRRRPTRPPTTTRPRCGRSPRPGRAVSAH